MIFLIFFYLHKLSRSSSTTGRGDDKPKTTPTCNGKQGQDNLGFSEETGETADLRQEKEKVPEVETLQESNGIESPSPPQQHPEKTQTTLL